MNLSCYYAETALSRLLKGAISNIGLKPVTLSQLLPSILTVPMRLTTTHDFIQQRHQDNQLMCQLSQERIRLINTVTYQQATLELKCVKILACVQQKNGSLVMLLKHSASSGISHHEESKGDISLCKH